MSKGPLLPTFNNESGRKSGGFPSAKVLTGLLVITAVNLFTFTQPQLTSHYISTIHHQVTRWSSYPAVLEKMVQSDDFAPSKSVKPAPKVPKVAHVTYEYEWTPSRPRQPLTPEPGIDYPEYLEADRYIPGEPESNSLRRVTGEPGRDVWSQEDVDEGLETIFKAEDFMSSDQVRAPISWKNNEHIREGDRSASQEEVRSPFDWAEIAKSLEEYNAEEDEPTSITAEALLQCLARKIEWESRHAKDSE